MNSIIFKTILWVVIGLSVSMAVRQLAGGGNSNITPITYSDFLEQVKSGEIRSAVIDERFVTADTNDGRKVRTNITYLDRGLVGDLVRYGVKFDVHYEEERSFLVSQLISWLPMILLVGVWIFFMRQIQGGKGGAFSFGKSRARMLDGNNNSITFADVAGCDEAKEEVSELVDFLKSPGRFKDLGGRIPRGVLMVGPPGTGKTLLARAIAGEAKVPFFTISGSDFVEMFVGVGAARMRDMFETAKKHAPCIVFVDEIDAVGRHRGGGTGGGNDEREQTLNQMLVEMDGFDVHSGVIVIAATNRPDVLDKALLRPGRFDRQVQVGLPDIRGRSQILDVHMRKVPLSPDVRSDIIARGTPGFSGADLANLVNEAALFAARRHKRLVEMSDFEDAKDKIFMGPERRSAVIREEERRNTAYHESGHAVVAKLLPKADPVHKVTIMPRGWALGLTWQLPEHDVLSHYRDKMLEEISILFAGRISEEIFMGHKSTGAANDFQRATKIARDMVTRYGMSDSLGTMVYLDDQEDSYFGKMSSKSISEATLQKVDTEIRRILDEQYMVARTLLEQNRDKVEAMAHALLEWETIDADQINDIMQGLSPRPPKIPAGVPHNPPPSNGGGGCVSEVNAESSPKTA